MDWLFVQAGTRNVLSHGPTGPSSRVSATRTLNLLWPASTAITMLRHWHCIERPASTRVRSVILDIEDIVIRSWRLMGRRRRNPWRGPSIFNIGGRIWYNLRFPRDSFRRGVGGLGHMVVGRAGRLHELSVHFEWEVEGPIGSFLGLLDLVAQEPRGPAELLDEVGQPDPNLSDRLAAQDGARASDLEPEVCISG